MGSLVRFDPYGDIGVDRGAQSRLERLGMGSGLPLDVYETEEGLVIEAALPGVDPDEIEVTVVGDSLTIKGEIKRETEEEGRHYYVRSRQFGSFSRTVSLPAYVDPDQTAAAYDRGVLKLTVARREETKPRQIKVQPK